MLHSLARESGCQDLLPQRIRNLPDTLDLGYYPLNDSAQAAAVFKPSTPAALTPNAPNIVTNPAAIVRDKCPAVVQQILYNYPDNVVLAGSAPGSKLIAMDAADYDLFVVGYDTQRAKQIINAIVRYCNEHCTIKESLNAISITGAALQGATVQVRTCCFTRFATHCIGDGELHAYVSTTCFTACVGTACWATRSH